MISVVFSIVPVQQQQQQQAQRFYPFVKWAGGKTQLLSQIDRYLPATFERYFEPFLGGGAVFFHLLSSRGPFEAHLSDVNSDLITAYGAVKERVEDLIAALRRHEARFVQERDHYYYELREAATPANMVERAARFIMLNKTCFNGLYRVNKSGRFNVPAGRYENPRICDEQALRQAKMALSVCRARLSGRHFGEALDRAREGDLVYMDPPYSPASSTAKFTQYTNGGFGDDDQSELCNVFEELTARGCKVLLSNSDTPFIRKLYARHMRNAVRIEAARAINCNPARRKGHTELLIRNFT